MRLKELMNCYRKSHKRHNLKNINNMTLYKQHNLINSWQLLKSGACAPIPLSAATRCKHTKLDYLDPREEEEEAAGSRDPNQSHVIWTLRRWLLRIRAYTRQLLTDSLPGRSKKIWNLLILSASRYRVTRSVNTIVSSGVAVLNPSLLISPIKKIWQGPGGTAVWLNIWTTLSRYTAGAISRRG